MITEAEAVLELNRLKREEGSHGAHEAADEILLGLLLTAGYSDAVAAYKALRDEVVFYYS